MKKLVIVFLVLLLGWNVYLTFRLEGIQNIQSSEITPNFTVVNNTINGFSTDLTKVVENVESSVVSVYTTNGMNQGSGFIWKAEAENVLILTNASLVTNSTEVEVVFDNGSRMEAAVVGLDRASDVALLNVVPEFNVEVLKSGESSFLKHGEWIIGIGSAQSELSEGTVSVGIVSSNQSEFLVDSNNDGIDDWSMLYLKTDINISRGLAGGPIVNLAGEVVGIASQFLEDSENEGFFFVTPIDELNLIAEQLEVEQGVGRIPLGIEVLDIESLTVYQKSFLGLSLDTISGIYVKYVQDNSPAEKAGIMVGDILTEIQEVDVSTLKKYRRSLYGLSNLDSFEMTLNRNNQKMKVTVILHD